jgi:riboflavin kinase/FMN adenylyltransferase
MRRCDGLDAARAVSFRRTAVTLGVFDGVHLGHRAVLERTAELARARGGDAVVVTFADHPRAVIEGRAPQWIVSLPHRLRLFEAAGVDAAVVLPFDAALRATSAEDFARLVFRDALRADVVLLGCDGRFGRGGEGDFAALRTFGARFGFAALQADRVTLTGEKISSTAIRAAILAGDLERAARMLGRRVSALGTVVRGDGRGRTLGWPTANLDLHHVVRPPRGVYGCEARFDDVRLPALTNIGVRPTFVPAASASAAEPAWEDRDASEKVEVHVLDYAGDLYGKELEIEFLTRIRDERRFAGRDALLARLAEDRREFESFLAGRARGAVEDVAAEGNLRAPDR